MITCLERTVWQMCDTLIWLMPFGMKISMLDWFTHSTLQVTDLGRYTRYWLE